MSKRRLDRAAEDALLDMLLDGLARTEACELFGLRRAELSDIALRRGMRMKPLSLDHGDIEAAVDLYESGLSLDKTVNALYDDRGVRIPRMTLSRILASRGVTMRRVGAPSGPRSKPHMERVAQTYSLACPRDDCSFRTTCVSHDDPWPAVYAAMTDHLRSRHFLRDGAIHRLLGEAITDDTKLFRKEEQILENAA